VGGAAAQGLCRPICPETWDAAAKQQRESYIFCRHTDVAEVAATGVVQQATVTCTGRNLCGDILYSVFGVGPAATVRRLLPAVHMLVCSGWHVPGPTCPLVMVDHKSDRWP